MEPDETSHFVEDSSSTQYTEPDKISRTAEYSFSTEPIENVSGPTTDPLTEPLPLKDVKIEGKDLVLFRGALNILKCVHCNEEL